MQHEELIAEDPATLQKAYERGFEGAYYDPDAMVALGKRISLMGGTHYGEDATRAYGLHGSGAGKLSLPFLAVVQHFPNCFPGFAQQRGDCVSHSTRNGIWISYMNELLYGKNEGGYSIPKVSPTGEQSGCISSSAVYWYRGHGSDGWSCADAAQVTLTRSAMWLCQDYPDLGFDLTKYSAAMAGKWGRTPPPENVTQRGQQNLCQNVTVCRDYESVRDMLAQGNAISSCGSEAFSNRRDKNGVSARTMGVWRHAMVYGGVDDRPETVEREGCGLIAVGNSWGAFNSGETLIPGTKHHLPQGWFWAKWTDLSNRYAVAFGASRGWPARRLPHWGLGGIV